MSQTMLTITGNVTHAPKICFGKKRGEPFCILKVAVNNQRFSPEAQEWLTTDTTFYELVCFGAIGASAMASIQVGDPVVAVGRFRVNAWEGETFKAQTPTLTVDHLGPDLLFGTAQFSRGRIGYAVDRTDEEVDFPALAESRQADEHATSSTAGAAATGGAQDVEVDAVEEGTEPPISADADGVVSEEDAQEYLAASA